MASNGAGVRMPWRCTRSHLRCLITAAIPGGDVVISLARPGRDTQDRDAINDHALARRLLAREDDYLRYTHDPVPFDNNAAKREVRTSKLRWRASDARLDGWDLEGFPSRP